ncbi:hypothetical protein KUCAC02_034311 [Chaenocephalus aceratus]|nr:hypothetical protein KUCAC02_034311 [Chaenocephalus aceratus]
MLYLEDYLEMIEQLPIDLRDRFTEMREMDLQVQNATDQLEQEVIEFFVNAKKNKPEWREEQMEVIKKDYYKALEDADEKVQLANQIYDLVDRHLRKLDQELAKFKMELEADNGHHGDPGETVSGDGQPVSAQRKHSAPAHHTTEHVPEKKFKSEALLSTLTCDASKENTPGCRSNITSGSTPSSSPLYSSLPAGPGAVGAISLAAAQAVQATAQMKDGRRTSSLKASYEAIKNTDFQLSREFSLSRENPGFSSSALASTLTSTLTPSPAADSRGASPKSSIKSSNHQSSSSSSSSSLSSCSFPRRWLRNFPACIALPEAEATARWTGPTTPTSPILHLQQGKQQHLDHYESRYCICNQCPIEWFHYGCVGLTEAPKGKWFCPQAPQP